MLHKNAQKLKVCLKNGICILNSTPHIVKDNVGKEKKGNLKVFFLKVDTPSCFACMMLVQAS
jgi:hypothetical protein